MAAIMASVAPHETVTCVSGSRSRPHAADCFFATACRSCGAPQVVAYWLYPSRSAALAASRIRRSVSKSVKLWTFSDSRSVPRIGPLQANVRAGARMTSLRRLQSSLPAPANVAGPARGREEVEHIGTAQKADHLSALDDRHAAHVLADEEPRRLVDARVLADGDDVRAHDVARDLTLLGEDIDLDRK